MALLVQKFGGTSVADPERMRAVAEHVQRHVRRGDQIVLVVSAMGKETDDLLRMASEVSGVRPSREMDMLITAGERKAIALMSMALAGVGLSAESLTGSQAGIRTDGVHMDAKITEMNPERIRTALDSGAVVVVAGAQGQSDQREITFLGRGGSDTTAVAIAEALNADACELYTDVSGVFTTDPRLVSKAQKIARISFDEMLEMTATGCPKPAMRSVEYARRHHVPLHVRSAFTWEPGTWVVQEDASMEQAVARAVTHDTSEAKITVSDVPDRPGVAARLFGVLASAGINVDMIVQNTSEAGVTDISFTCPQSDVDKALESVENLRDELKLKGVAADRQVARVSLIGAGMKSNPGVAAQMFEVLAANDINIDMISTSAIRISCVVAEPTAELAVQLLHTHFGLDAK